MIQITKHEIINWFTINHNNGMQSAESKEDALHESCSNVNDSRLEPLYPKGIYTRSITDFFSPYFTDQIQFNNLQA